MRVSANNIKSLGQFFRDYLTDFDKVRDFYKLGFSTEEAFHRQIHFLRKFNHPRRELAQILKKQNKRFGASRAVFDAIEKLESGGANVIITGQQVGLFGGPMYVLYKALTAIKLAKSLQESGFGAVVPVFWLASEDSDFAEVNHVDIFGKRKERKRLRIERTRDGNVSMSKMPLGDQIGGVLEALADSTFDTEFKSEVIEALSAAYSPQASLSDAFGLWLMRCLREFGVILIDPSDPKIRALQSGIFVQEILEQSPSTRAVLETSRKLTQAGYRPQVPLRDGRLNLFFNDEERLPLEFAGRNVRTTDGKYSFSLAELAQIAQEQPEKFSPNVILRGLTQDSLFPTIAYVGGSAEVAYFGQLKEVYSTFGVPMPILYPRKSVTILEGNIARILEKHHLRVSDLWGDVEALMTEKTRAKLSGKLMNAMEKMKQDWPQELTALSGEIRALDPTLEKMLGNTAGRIANNIETLEKKIVQAGKRQNDILRQQLTHAATAIYPGNNLQERVYNFAPYLVKYGFDFIQKVCDQLDLTHFDHQIINP